MRTCLTRSVRNLRTPVPRPGLNHMRDRIMSESNDCPAHEIRSLTVYIQQGWHTCCGDKISIFSKLIKHGVGNLCVLYQRKTKRQTFPTHRGTPYAWSADPSNPRNWTKHRKWAATLTACYMSSLVSIAASSYSQAVNQMVTDLRAPYLLVVSGISFFTLSVAVFPLILAPIGEMFGRQRVYIVSYAIFFLFFLPIALAENIQTILTARFVCGAAGSVGSTMVGGTLSDLWEKNERELPMSLFALSSLLGTPAGLIIFTWAGGSTSWRWIFWTQLLLAVPSSVVIILFFRQETFPKVARDELRKADNASAHATDSVNKFNPKCPFSNNAYRWQTLKPKLIKSALRPLHFLATEPIALALSIWIAFAWGVLYLFLESVPLVFESYGFTHTKNTRGLSFVGIAVGSLLGFSAHLLVIRHRHIVQFPEQRLPEACAGAIFFSGGFFIFAWTAHHPVLHWIVPQIGTSIIMFGLYLVYVSNIRNKGIA